MILKATTIALLTGAISTCTDMVDEGRIITIEEGPAITRQIEAQDFDRLTVAGRYDVIVVEGDTPSIEIEGPEAALNRTAFDFEGDELTIRPDDEDDKVIIRWADGTKVTVRITTAALKEATIAGAGTMQLAAVDAERFSGTIAGSGDIKIDRIAAKRADFTIAGSGAIDVRGSADVLDLSIGGSGDFLNQAFSATNADISIAGSGDVAAQVSGEADISIAGSGDVTLTGGANCSVSKFGSGDVSCS
ncbi:head GIN domain-containing protein [Sphingomicrobium arenosum]|uniref:head GIN domain-containing protein n=1 Tax=Sphingomicrobium arenosum TaxID=2233861 RepID=UPI002240F535|nr:head GIN domain-containing protein [Sphingomicrobium arenosum]